VVNNSVLTFNRSNAPVFAAPISGTGAVNVIGSGTITLTNANSYSGQTTISAGVLQLGNGGTTGSLSPSTAITNNATLAFNRSNALAVSNSITGTGVVNQIGAGTTTLSGANTYTGGTALTVGSLIVTNTTGSATGTGVVTTALGTILGGTGIIAPTGSNAVTINGTLSPGVAGTNNGVGALTLTPVNGNVTLASTSNVIFQLGSNGTNGLVLTYNPDGTINTISGTPSLTGNDRVVFSASGTGILDFTAATSASLDVVFASGYTPQALDAFDLIDWNNVAISGLNVGLLDLPSLGNPSLVWDTSKFVSNGVIAVAQIVATPEPARASLLVGGLAWFCFKRHRRGETMV
jgi:autotransporter-associated beta strand protein